jgi:hypothetical protein
MPDSSPKEAATCTMCGHPSHLQLCGACFVNGDECPAVLPGNPGSDWTEQDERMMRTYAEISDTELSDWPQSSDMPHRLAREILRLRAENERHVVEISRLGAALYRLQA